MEDVIHFRPQPSFSTLNQEEIMTTQLEMTKRARSLASDRRGSRGHRSIELLDQAVRIGQEIKDPRMIDAFSEKLNQLRGGGNPGDL